MPTRSSTVSRSTPSPLAASAWASQAGATWVELNFSDDVELEGDKIDQSVERIRELVPAGEVEVTAGYVRFATGQRFLDYVADSRKSYRRDDVEP